MESTALSAAPYRMGRKQLQGTPDLGVASFIITSVI